MREVCCCGCRFRETCLWAADKISNRGQERWEEERLSREMKGMENRILELGEHERYHSEA